MKAYVLIPQSNISLGKLSQVMIHGAKVIEIQGNFDMGLTLVSEATQQYPITLVIAIRQPSQPIRMPPNMDSLAGIFKGDVGA